MQRLSRNESERAEVFSFQTPAILNESRVLSARSGLQHHTAMALLTNPLRAAARHVRLQQHHFSTSTSLAAAAEVRKLGVIGAGQMVGFDYMQLNEAALLTKLGIRNSSSSCTEGQGADSTRGHFPSFN